MTKSIEMQDDGTYLVAVDYNDENVPLTVSKKFIGSEVDAQAYASSLDRDARMNNSHLFPVPEMPVLEGEEDLL